MTQNDHHDHMVNVVTGEVIEFNCDEIERLQKEIVDRAGFVLEDHSLVLYVKPKGSD
jgi:Fur family ferric uptake transcriptional regulator